MDQHRKDGTHFLERFRGNGSLPSREEDVLPFGRLCTKNGLDIEHFKALEALLASFLSTIIVAEIPHIYQPKGGGGGLGKNLALVSVEMVDIHGDSVFNLA